MIFFSCIFLFSCLFLCVDIIPDTLLYFNCLWRDLKAAQHTNLQVKFVCSVSIWRFLISYYHIKITVIRISYLCLAELFTFSALIFFYIYFFRFFLPGQYGCYIVVERFLLEIGFRLSDTEIFLRWRYFLLALLNFLSMNHQKMKSLLRHTQKMLLKKSKLQCLSIPLTQVLTTCWIHNYSDGLNQLSCYKLNSKLDVYIGNVEHI